MPVGARVTYNENHEDMIEIHRPPQEVELIFEDNKGTTTITINVDGEKRMVISDAENDIVDLMDKRHPQPPLKECPTCGHLRKEKLDEDPSKSTKQKR